MAIDMDLFNKIQDKNLGESKDTRNIPKHNKGNIQQAKSQHQSKWRETHSDPTEIRNKTSCPFSLYPFNIVLEVLARAIKATKGDIGGTNWKKKSKFHYLLMI